jgi:hypothetical protein
MRSPFSSMATISAVLLAFVSCGSTESAPTKPSCTGPVERYDNCIGTSTSSDGASYTGDWRNGRPDGNGEMRLPNGDKYVGSFVEGKAEGLAIVYYPNGQKHVGNYRQDRADGVFVLYAADGSTQTVIVYNDNKEDAEETKKLREQLLEAMGAAKLSDFETAFDIWMPLAEKGNAEAQYNIAIMNEHGEGIPQNHTLAHEWMKKAADQHHPMAQYYLGIYLSNGIGVSVDKTSFHHWVVKSAENGVIPAQREVALNYKEGVGVPKDSRRAMYWFAVAALNKDLYGALELGNAFSNGQLVKRDRLRAYQWYYIATGYQGPNYPNVDFRDVYASPLAEKELTKLSQSMKKSEIAKARAMTDKCLLEDSLNEAFKTCGLTTFNQ